MYVIKILIKTTSSSDLKPDLKQNFKGDENGPVASNLRKKGKRFHKENAKTSPHKENFFFKRIIPE